MGTTTELKGYVVGQTKTPSAPQWSDFNYGEYTFRQDRIRTNTVRRTKPKDLFANQTEFSTTLRTRTQSVGTKVTVAGYTRAPVSYWTSVSTPTPMLEQPTNDVRFKILEKIKSQNVNLAQSVAEYRQTCSMFAGAARDIVRGFHSLRSGRALADFVKILQHPTNTASKRIANRWLEYQYGFKPLLSDIYGTAELLATELNHGRPMFVSASSKREKHSGGTKSVDGGNLPFSVHEWTEARIRARYLISDAKLKSLSQSGLSNPLLLAWELVPYSFVVDWLLPVGRWLSVLDALNGTSQLKINLSTRYKCQTYITNVYGGRMDYEERSTYRAPTDTSLPLPKLRYQPSTSFTAVVNGLALLTQLRGKFK